MYVLGIEPSAKNGCSPALVERQIDKKEAVGLNCLISLLLTIGIFSQRHQL